MTCDKTDWYDQELITVYIHVLLRFCQAPDKTVATKNGKVNSRSVDQRKHFLLHVWEYHHVPKCLCGLCKIMEVCEFIERTIHHARGIRWRLWYHLRKNGTHRDACLSVFYKNCSLWAICGTRWEHNINGLLAPIHVFLANFLLWEVKVFEQVG